jgi:hypothetical protein
VLDTKPYARVLDRSWAFRTVGYGHGEDLWRRLLSVLSAVGYDGAVSIEHEDELMTVDEGLAKAVRFLQRELLEERRAVAFSTQAKKEFWKHRVAVTPTPPRFNRRSPTSPASRSSSTSRPARSSAPSRPGAPPRLTPNRQRGRMPPCRSRGARTLAR